MLGKPPHSIAILKPGTYLCNAFWKMSLQAKKSFVWLWMTALLSATFGMSVQQVYCYCTGETTVSLFSTNDACKVEKLGAIKANCCAEKKASAKKRSCCEKNDTQPRGCTKKTTQVFQLRTEFEVNSSDFKKLEHPKTWAIASSFYFNFAPKSLVLKSDFHRFEQAFPLPRSGRNICLRHGVFRC